MQPFGVLDRYIGKTIFTTIMMTLFMLVSLSGIIKFVDQLKKAGQGSYDALGAGMYTLLSVPKDVQIFFPMAALLGALLGLGMLAQRSELVVMQASGFTRMQVALSVMKTAIPLVLLTMAIGEWVAPQGEQMARNYRAQAMYGGSLLSTQQGLWAKDGNNFVYIERVKGDEELGGISIYAFNENRRLQSVRYAATAKFDPEHKVWRLSQVDESDLTNPKQITGSQTVSGTWKTNLTPDKLGVVALDPDALSISGLHNYVKYLKSSGQDAVLGNGITYRPDAYNNDLTWEKTTTYNIGVDLGFLDNRITANFDYYYRKTKDLINDVYVAAGSNFKNKVTSNIGSLHNKGFEFAVTWRAIQQKDWRWELGFNLTHNTNEIDELVKSTGDKYIIRHGGIAVGDSGSNGIKGYSVGEAVSAFYTYQQVYDEKGQPIEGEFVDRDNNGIINDNDRYFYKKSDPDVLMGLSSKLIYKNWDFSFSLRASLGNYAYNAVECSRSDLSVTGIYSGNAWHNVPQMSLAKNWKKVDALDALSDYFIQNASFLKCDNITLGYSFDKLFGQKISGRAYLTAQNVFTITKYKGLDPEINGGYDGSIYPRPLVGIFGLSLNF